MSRTFPRPIRGKGRSLDSIVFIRSGFQAALAANRRGRETKKGVGRSDSLLGQRNELMLLRNRVETAGFPVLFGLLDPLLAGRDKIPPDMAQAFQRIAAEEHHPGRPRGLHGDAVAWPEDQELRRLVAIAGDLDLAVDEI